MTTIKAIDTIYRGYKFRSRLEARWAVFLDRVGLQWEYEFEGFALPSGYYLPDFYFPRDHWWLEVKPPREIPFGRTGQSREYQLADDLAHMHGWADTVVVIAYGDPIRALRAWGNLSAAGLKFPPDEFRKHSARRDEAMLAARQARFEHGEAA